MSGLGAGGDATASSVMGDVIAIARGIRAPVFGVSVNALVKAPRIDPRELEGKYYIGLKVCDKPGVMADVSAILRDQNISIETVIQKGHHPEEYVNLFIVTHQALHEDIINAKDLIARLSVVDAEPTIIRIEEEL